MTVTNIDLPRQRIALSMKANPQIGAKVGGATGPGQRPNARPGTPETSARHPQPQQTLNND